MSISIRQSQKAKYVNIIILGDTNVDKASIIQKYNQNQHIQENMSTLGLDFVLINYTSKISQQEVVIKIWDTAKQERFKTLTASFYNYDGVIFAYNIAS